MTFEQILSGINSLSPTEQVRVVNAIWDQLPLDVGGILPNNEAALLNQRWQHYLDDPSTAITEDQFRAMLKEKRAE